MQVTDRSQTRKGAPIESRHVGKFIRAKDAPGYVPMSGRYLRKLVVIGMLPAYKVGRRVVCYRLSDLDSLMEKCRIGRAVES